MGVLQSWLIDHSPDYLWCKGFYVFYISSILWTDETKGCFIKEKGSAHKHLIPTIKYTVYGGAMMVCGCLLPQGLDSLLSSTEQVYQDILQENVRPSVHQLTLNRSWVMQQDSYPKHRNKPSFVKEMVQKTLLNDVQVWPAITGNVWYIFLHCESIHGVFNKDMKMSLFVTCLSRLWWRLNQICELIFQNSLHWILSM